MARRSMLFGAIAGIGIVLGIGGRATRIKQDEVRGQARLMLESVKARGAASLPREDLSPQVTETLIGFERARGRIDSFEFGNASSILGLGPTQIGGSVTRKGKPFTFSVVMGSGGQIVSYHEG